MVAAMIAQRLDRPLAVFDIESTGLNRQLDRIIDLAIVVIQPDGEQTAHTYRVNPERPIPADSTAVHGISDEDVRNAPTFAQVAAEVAALLAPCDLSGFNLQRFDIPMLLAEFQRVGVPFSMEGRRVIDVQRIFHMKEPRDLTAALQFYCDEAHEGAHGALDDVEATLRVLDAQLERYDDLPADMDGLHELLNPRDPSWADSQGKIRWQDGELVINFGQKQGVRIKQLVLNDPGYLEWILRRDFPDDTKDLIRNAINNRYPAPPGS
jgi:DNA polymerase III subunit epsilon